MDNKNIFWQEGYSLTNPTAENEFLDKQFTYKCLNCPDSSSQNLMINLDNGSIKLITKDKEREMKTNILFINVFQ